jgi:hypothetical protein
VFSVLFCPHHFVPTTTTFALPQALSLFEMLGNKKLKVLDIHLRPGTVNKASVQAIAMRAINPYKMRKKETTVVEFFLVDWLVAVVLKLVLETHTSGFLWRRTVWIVPTASMMVYFVWT